MDVLTAALVLVHVGVTAAWLGAMLYSIFVVQRRMASFFRDPEEREDFAVLLAAGARWKVLGLASALALSGAGLVALEVGEADDPTAAWLALVAAKAVLLALAVALFAYVSWQLWPARLLARMAGTGELEAYQRRFVWAALALTSLIGLGLVLGVAADAAR